MHSFIPCIHSFSQSVMNSFLFSLLHSFNHSNNHSDVKLVPSTVLVSCASGSALFISMLPKYYANNITLDLLLTFNRQAVVSKGFIDD